MGNPTSMNFFYWKTKSLHMLKNPAEFERIYKSDDVFTGFFDLRTPNCEGKIMNADVMDMDFIGRVFENCLILGGDFTSGGFHDCNFHNCFFLESALVGCDFENCKFKKTEFINIQISFSIGARKPCVLEGLQISNLAPGEDALAFAKRTVFGESEIV